MINGRAPSRGLGRFLSYDSDMDQLGGTRVRAMGFHPLAAILSLIVAVGLLIVVMPVMLVLGLIGLAMLAILWAWLGIRAWLARARSPNGALDGRRNVRVRVPGEGRTLDPDGR